MEDIKINEVSRHVGYKMVDFQTRSVIKKKHKQHNVHTILCTVTGHKRKWGPSKLMKLVAIFGGFSKILHLFQKHFIIKVESRS